MESNDSPEIPDGGDIRHPRPPFGGIREEIVNCNQMTTLREKLTVNQKTLGVLGDRQTIGPHRKTSAVKQTSFDVLGETGRH